MTWQYEKILHSQQSWKPNIFHPGLPGLMDLELTIEADVIKSAKSSLGYYFRDLEEVLNFVIGIRPSHFVLMLTQ